MTTYNLKTNLAGACVAFTLALLSACGGGGGGTDASISTAAAQPAPGTEPVLEVSAAPVVDASTNSNVTTTTSTTPVTTTTVPVTTQTTPSGPSQYSLVAGAEATPTFRPGQPGSLLALGNTAEGFYGNRSGFTLIGNDGKTIIRDLVGYRVGSISVSGNNWSFNPGATSLFISSVPITGSGTVTFGTSLNGSSTASNSTATTSIALTYLDSNGFAASQASVAGTWGSTASMVITVDAAGGVTGTSLSSSTFGSCSFSGTLVQGTTGSGKNMFNFSITATGDNGCRVDKDTPYIGLAAITFNPAGFFVSNGAYRTISFTALTSANSIISAGLRKQ